MKKAFMIMQIGNPELDDMYESIYKPIAQECGLRLYRVDKDNEGDLIKKTIDKYIKEAEIIIADLTNERPSCYHEVGFAYGLGRYMNVILTVREDHSSTSKNFNSNGPKIHFDLNDYPRITWKDDEIDEFKEKLLQEIKKRLSGIKKKGSIGASTEKDKKKWFVNHYTEAMNNFGKLEEKGFIEVNVYSDSLVDTFGQDEIRDVTMNLKHFRNRFPFAYLTEINNSPFDWKFFKNEIVKNFVLKEKNNVCIYTAIRKDLSFFILSNFAVLSNFAETKNKNGIIYTDRMIYYIVDLILFIEDFYNKFKLKRRSILNITVKHYNINKFKLLTPIERELGRALGNPFTAIEKNISSEINVSLTEISTNFIGVVQELLKDIFVIYDAKDYLVKEGPDVISHRVVI